MARKRLPEKLYRIGEIMEHSGLSRQTLNFYATLGLIREQQRTPAGHRLFPPSVFADLERVKGLQKKGFTLQKIREMLEEPRHAPRSDAAETLHSEVFERPSED
jgi:DNA-binding transcriptional MerR regulator